MAVGYEDDGGDRDRRWRSAYETTMAAAAIVMAVGTRTIAAAAIAMAVGTRTIAATAIAIAVGTTIAATAITMPVDLTEISAEG